MSIRDHSRRPAAGPDRGSRRRRRSIRLAHPAADRHHRQPQRRQPLDGRVRLPSREAGAWVFLRPAGVAFWRRCRSAGGWRRRASAPAWRGAYVLTADQGLRARAGQHRHGQLDAAHRAPFNGLEFSDGSAGLLHRPVHASWPATPPPRPRPCPPSWSGGVSPSWPCRPVTITLKDPGRPILWRGQSLVGEAANLPGSGGYRRVRPRPRPHGRRRADPGGPQPAALADRPDRDLPAAAAGFLRREASAKSSAAARRPTIAMAWVGRQYRDAGFEGRVIPKPSPCASPATPWPGRARPSSPIPAASWPTRSPTSGWARPPFRAARPRPGPIEGEGRGAGRPGPVRLGQGLRRPRHAAAGARQLRLPQPRRPLRPRPAAGARQPRALCLRGDAGAGGRGGGGQGPPGLGPACFHRALMARARGQQGGLFDAADWVGRAARRGRRRRRRPGPGADRRERR